MRFKNCENRTLPCTREGRLLAELILDILCDIAATFSENDLSMDADDRSTLFIRVTAQLTRATVRIFSTSTWCEK